MGTRHVSEVRWSTCSTGTSSQWVAYDVRKKAYKRKVGAMSPLVGGSSLIIAAVQAEFHGKCVAHLYQPHRARDRSWS